MVALEEVPDEAGAGVAFSKAETLALSSVMEASIENESMLEELVILPG